MKDVLFYLASVLVLVSAIFSFMRGWSEWKEENDDDMEEF